jgi:hypothetical protein
MDPDVHAGMLAAAAADGMSVSAWLTRAAKRALIVSDGMAAVAEWEAEHGAFSEAEMERARRIVTAELRAGSAPDGLQRDA